MCRAPPDRACRCCRSPAPPSSRALGEAARAFVGGRSVLPAPPARGGGGGAAGGGGTRGGGSSLPPPLRGDGPRDPGGALDGESEPPPLNTSARHRVDNTEI